MGNSFHCLLLKADKSIFFSIIYVIYDKVSFLIIAREEAVHWNLQVYDFATLVSLMVLIGLVWSLFYLMDETSFCIFFYEIYNSLEIPYSGLES